MGDVHGQALVKSKRPWLNRIGIDFEQDGALVAMRRRVILVLVGGSNGLRNVTRGLMLIARTYGTEAFRLA